MLRIKSWAAYACALVSASAALVEFAAAESSSSMLRVRGATGKSHLLPNFDSVINDEFLLTSDTAQSSIKVGDEICITNYIMDQFCINSGYLLDAPDVTTLENPEEHSYHHLLNVDLSIESGFVVLTDKNDTSGLHCLGYRLEDTDAVLDAGHAAGRHGFCDECTGDDTKPTHGYRATIKGIVKELGDGSDGISGTPLLGNIEVLDESVGCDRTIVNPVCVAVPEAEVVDDHDDDDYDYHDNDHHENTPPSPAMTPDTPKPTPKPDTPKPTPKPDTPKPTPKQDTPKPTGPGGVNKAAWLAHGIMGFIAWGVLVPFAVESAILHHLRRSNSFWIQLHRAFNSIAFTMFIAFFVVAVAFTGKEGGTHLHGSHQKVGLAMFIMATAQVLGGALRPSLPATNSGRLKSAIRKGWEVGHRLVGVTLLPMAFWQISKGIQLYSVKYSVAESDMRKLTTIYRIWIGGVTAIIVLGGGLRLATCADKESFRSVVGVAASKSQRAFKGMS